MQPVKLVNNLTKTVFVYADSERVNGEVSSAEVIVERTVFHDRLSAVTIVRLTSCTDKLKLSVVEMKLSGTEIAVNGNFSSSTELFSESFGKLNATSNSHEVNIFGMTL